MKIRQCNVPYGNHSDFEYKTFLQPPKTSWPAYSWVWNVNVTREGIMQQIDEFCKSKIKVVYVLPEPREFRPEAGYTLDGYLQESYMQLYRFACEYAFSKGMQVWLYDEGGWPSGSANGAVVLSNPALEKKCYAERVVTLQPGAAYVKPADAVGAFFTDYTPVPDGYMPKEEEKICEYFIKVGHYTHMPFPDLLNPESTKAFLRCTHDRYVAAMGDLIGEDFRVVFTDEPTIASTVWTDDLEKRFADNRPAYRLDGYSGKVFADGVKRKDGTTEFSRKMWKQKVNSPGSWQS